MSASWMATTNGCPDWEFGQVVHHTKDPKFYGLVLGWNYRVDYNPTESIVVLVALTAKNSLKVGQVFEPYCGWWEPVP